MYLFFDTETTGLPKNWKAPVTDTDNWPRMIQIGWVLCDESGTIVNQKDYIIAPEGFTIPAESAAVHGITTERAVLEGVPLQEVLDEFNALVEKAQYIVAHNISFDEKIIGAEFIRKQVPSRFEQTPKLCTMHASTNYCKIPGNYGFKWPKLQELHVKLFGEEFEEAHDAAADIGATVKCFWKMRELKLI